MLPPNIGKALDVIKKVCSKPGQEAQVGRFINHTYNTISAKLKEGVTLSDIHAKLVKSATLSDNTDYVTFEKEFKKHCDKVSTFLKMN